MFPSRLALEGKALFCLFGHRSQIRVRVTDGVPRACIALSDLRNHPEFSLDPVSGRAATSTRTNTWHAQLVNEEGNSFVDRRSRGPRSRMFGQYNRRSCQVDSGTVAGFVAGVLELMAGDRAHTYNATGDAVDVVHPSKCIPGGGLLFEFRKHAVVCSRGDVR